MLLRFGGVQDGSAFALAFAAQNHPAGADGDGVEKKRGRGRPKGSKNQATRDKEERERIFPHLELSMCVNTGPSSFVDVAVYPNQAVADKNKEARQKFHDDVFGASLKDEFFYEGDIDYFYQSEHFKKLSF